MDQSDGLPTKEANQQTEKRTMSFPDVDDTTIIIPNKPIFDYKEKSIGKKRAQTFDVEHGIIREKIEMSILRIRFLDGTEMQIQKISTDLVNFINPVLKKRKMLTIIDLKETLGEIDKLEEEGVRLEYTIQKMNFDIVSVIKIRNHENGTILISDLQGRCMM